MSSPDSDDVLLANKSILFIANDFKGLARTVGFLERRSMQIFHASALKEAVEILTQRKIDFVFLSINLQNATPAKVIPMLTTSFKMTTIAFAEKAELGTRVALNSIQHDHKIYAPLNGPKTAHKILQILRNENQPDRDKEKSDDRISVKSSSYKEEASFIGGSAVEPKTDIIIQKGNRGTLHSAIEDGDSADGINVFDAEPRSPLVIDTERSKLGNFKGHSQQKGPAAGEDGSRQHHVPTVGAGQKLDLEPELLKRKADRVASAASTSADVPTLTQPERPAAISNIQSKRADAKPSATAPAEIHSSLSPKFGINPHLIALENIADNPLAIKRICALTIKSKNFNGYVVMGMKEGVSVPVDLIQRIRATLIRHLGRQGEEIEAENLAFQMDVSKNEFATWAKEFADYIAVGEASDDGISMAFISGEDALPFLKVSVAPHMRAIARKDIKPDTVLDFDIYLHFPNNSRFVRYGIRGGTITADQLNRLKQAGVVYFHLPEEQQKSFKAYCGKHYVRARLLDSKDVIQLSKAFKTVAI